MNECLFSCPWWREAKRENTEQLASELSSEVHLTTRLFTCAGQTWPDVIR